MEGGGAAWWKTSGMNCCLPKLVLVVLFVCLLTSSSHADPLRPGGASGSRADPVQERWLRSQPLLQSLSDPAALAGVRARLAELRERFGEPGAPGRAAAIILDDIGALTP